MGLRAFGRGDVPPVRTCGLSWTTVDDGRARDRASGDPLYELDVVAVRILEVGAAVAPFCHRVARADVQPCESAAERVHVRVGEADVAAAFPMSGFFAEREIARSPV